MDGRGPSMHLIDMPAGYKKPAQKTRRSYPPGAFGDYATLRDYFVNEFGIDDSELMEYLFTVKLHGNRNFFVVPTDRGLKVFGLDMKDGIYMTARGRDIREANEKLNGVMRLASS